MNTTGAVHNGADRPQTETKMRTETWTEAERDAYVAVADTIPYPERTPWGQVSVDNTRIRNEARIRREAALHGWQTAMYQGFFRARQRKDYAFALDIAYRAIEVDLGDTEQGKLNWLNRRDTMLRKLEARGEANDGGPVR